MVVVKADAYGHGHDRVRRVAREAGADWLGVATPDEALALREAGDDGRLLAWLYGPDTDLAPWSPPTSTSPPSRRSRSPGSWPAAGTTERRARVHLKIDTGLSRNGATAADWPTVCRAAAAGRADRRRAGGRSASGRTWPPPTSSAHPSVPIS